MFTRKFFILILAMLMGGGVALANDKTDSGKHCLSLTNISDIKIIDNQHIRFNMYNGPDYMNVLSNKCPGLSPNDPIMYKTSLDVLCDLDMFTVLDSVGGGYMPGATCGFGKFVPVQKTNKKDK